MAYCYLCGKHIEKGRHLRRKVRTGELLSKHYERQKMRTVTTRYGWRIVCSSCGHYLDELAAKEHAFTLSTGLLVLCAVLVLAVLFAKAH